MSYKHAHQKALFIIQGFNYLSICQEMNYKCTTETLAKIGEDYSEKDKMWPGECLRKYRMMYRV